MSATDKQSAGAAVLCLPTASLQQVQQWPGGRGRYPKGIASLHRERWARSSAHKAAQLAAARDRVRREIEECKLRRFAATDALLAAERAFRAVNSEWDALERLENSINAELVALARAGCAPT